MYQQIMFTPCDDHAVEKPSLQPNQCKFYHEAFHRFPADTFHSIVQHLKRVFIHLDNPVATWSVNVTTSAHNHSRHKLTYYRSCDFTYQAQIHWDSSYNVHACIFNSRIIAFTRPQRHPCISLLQLDRSHSPKC